MTRKPIVLLALFSSCIVGCLAQTTTVDGTEATGPTSQGGCTLSGTGWLCNNGAFCSWGGSSFTCVGGSGTVEEVTGPPGRTCTSHLDHFDCSDDGEESTCELDAGVWVCTSYGSSGESGSASSSTCVVHGGHTHGDCSNSCNGVDLGEYNLGLHVGSLFIVMVGSIIGVTLPIIASKFIKTAAWFFFVARHFGTGVILSTAFIHLLYHSFIMFANACLGELHFEPAAAAISLAGLYVVFFFDYVVMRWLKSRADKTRGVCHAHDGEIESADSAKEDKPVPSNPHGHESPVDADYSSEQSHWDVVLLESGILFHSIMIGVSLGSSGGSQWIPLFIAIIFHQFFEGLALGSRIALLEWKPGHAWKRWMMCGLFGIITAIGIAIGIGVHASYNPNSGSALLSIGILDSLSAGILLYSGVVELLVKDFFHGSLAGAGKFKTAAAFLALLAGTLCMSVLGKWA